MLKLLIVYFVLKLLYILINKWLYHRLDSGPFLAQDNLYTITHLIIYFISLIIVELCNNFSFTVLKQGVTAFLYFLATFVILTLSLAVFLMKSNEKSIQFLQKDCKEKPVFIGFSNEQFPSIIGQIMQNMITRTVMVISAVISPFLYLFYVP